MTCQKQLQNFEFVDQSKSIKKYSKSIKANSIKLAINNIYNSHYSGSTLWNLFEVGASRIESTFNRYVKVILDLPYATHRYLIEPLTGEMHIKKVLISIYLGFMEKIASSKKRAVKMLMETSKKEF